MLDALARAPNRKEKDAVMRPVLEKMDAQQVHWLCCIILKGACCAPALLPRCRLHGALRSG
jgi:hypothetical protein